MSLIVSEQYELVIGVDTHAATHTFALVAGGTGAVLDRVVFPTSSAWAGRRTGWQAGSGLRRAQWSWRAPALSARS